MKTRNYFTIAFILLLAISASARKSSFNGYIVTTENDTLYGKVFVAGPTANELKVKFIDENNSKSFFKARDLQSYAFEVPKFNKETRKHGTEWIQYVRKTVEDAPVRFGTTDIMIEKQVDGDIQVFNQYTEADEKIGGTLKHYFYVESTGKVDFSKVTKGNYKEIMKTATADFMELNNKIGKKGFGYKYIVKIAKIYNQHKASRQHAAN
jgi:hypothetical protein